MNIPRNSDFISFDENYPIIPLVPSSISMLTWSTYISKMMATTLIWSVNRSFFFNQFGLQQHSTLICLITDQFIAPLNPARYLHFRFMFSLSLLHTLWSDLTVTFTWFSSWVIHFLLSFLLGRCSRVTLRPDGKFSSYSNLRDLRSIASFISVADGTLSLHQKVCSSVSIIEFRFYCVYSSIGTDVHTPVSN